MSEFTSIAEAVALFDASQYRTEELEVENSELRNQLTVLKSVLDVLKASQ
jgi:hypothetical protein